MGDPSVDFFENLHRRGTDAGLRDLTVTVRFDLADGEPASWLVTVDRGDIRVSPGPGEANCAVAGDRHIFARLTSGAVDPMAALVGGELALSGDAALLVRVLRLFPGPHPAAARHPVAVERSHRE